jgi:hypothetical protein
MVVIAEREINRGGRWPKMSENILIFIVRELIILLNRIAMEFSGQKFVDFAMPQNCGDFSTLAVHVDVVVTTLA